MIEKKLKEDLFDKIPQNARCLIFGACDVGKRILNDININRPDVKIIGFIDNKKEGDFCNLPIVSLKTLLSQEQDYELVIMSTRRDFNILNSIFNLYKIPVLIQSAFLFEYYRNKHPNLNIENYTKVKNIFCEEKDKNLFSLIFKTRLKIKENKEISDYYKEYYDQNTTSIINLEKQYLENINKEKIRTIFDLGFNSGLNVLAYNKTLPNIEKIYGFEAIYQSTKEEYIENIIKNDSLKIIPKCIGEKEDTVDFYINNIYTARSFCSFSEKPFPKDINNWKKIKVDITTIDNFCTKNNIYPDFIKMDIEGAELPALRGGIKTIQKIRPQLAISIYHSDNDFINIPLYLYENLKDYTFYIGHYCPLPIETILYAIPNELK